MKTLFIIRHANAEWKSSDKMDFSRALNPLGIKEAKAIAQQLINKNFFVDAIIYSSALRTLQTAEIIANAFGVFENRRIAEPSLYLANSDKIEELVSQFPDELNCIAIIAHNPGVTDFANTLITHAFMYSMPTCAVVAVRSNAENWSAFSTGKKELLFALSPS
jgi:phosphohistidine phosphatase